MKAVSADKAVMERRELMTERELKKLSRIELIELLLEQSKENAQLRAMLKQAQDQLDDRAIRIEKAGSIAEASLQLNGVFQAAQAACEQYIENVEHLSSRQEEICAQMERDTQAKCAKMLAEAKKQSQDYWDEVSRKIKNVTSSYAELQTILKQAPVETEA